MRRDTAGRANLRTLRYAKTGKAVGAFRESPNGRRRTTVKRHPPDTLAEVPQMNMVASGQRLTASEAETLWRAWTTRRDSAARDRLVLSYSPMVSYLASRKVRELPSHCELDDLASCGLVALIESVDRFDPKKGATFEQYAWTRVSGAIMDELRRQDWASRSVRHFARQIDSARDDFFVKNGHAPSESELAEALDVPLSEIRRQLGELERADVYSLNAPTRAGDDSVLLEIGDTVENRELNSEPEKATLAS